LSRAVNPRLIVVLLLILASVAGFAQTGRSQAPDNPAFIEYWSEANAAARLHQAVTSEGRTLGKIPSPVNRSHLALEPPVFKDVVTPPSSYDLRTANGQNRVTPVRDQGDCGACWTFAALASVESGLLPGETRDFSENNMNTQNGFDKPVCQGGNAEKASAYLVRWSGPVNETDDPYNKTNTNPTSPQGVPVQKHLQNINIYAARTSATDNTILKTALMTDGALHTSMYGDNSKVSSVRLKV
jgi:C1A family cysteine protease